MSVQFGRWNLDGKPLDLDYVQKAQQLIAPYGPDDCSFHTRANISIQYSAFHTTAESRRESQPYISPTGAVVTWGGRLDNREQIVRELRNDLTVKSADASIVAAAYDKWNTDCFAKLIGDWALSIWVPDTRSLILAKDPIGTRHLYYTVDNNHVAWSSILETLVLLAERPFTLNEEYIAGWLSLFPATHLTPYVGIHSVPPSSFVTLRRGKQSVTRYWNFDPDKEIHYRTDGEYEEHFRTVFAEAVRRRLRSDRPVLAELSGGMDSSSIVCMADRVIASGAVDAPRLDTLSYYNDSEPNWNERPYFSKVEEKRGRTGCHIDISSQESFKVDFDNDRFAATPAAPGRPDQAANAYAAFVITGGHRVVLSGIGGDEVTGGLPTPTPELQDILSQGRLRVLARQLKAWALNKRQPWFYLLFEAARGFFPPVLLRPPKHKRPAPWLHPRFVNRYRQASRGYSARVKFFGPLPSLQDNISMLEVLRRQLACTELTFAPLCEKRYPFLDRDFLEFMFAIPREQIVRPGRRRSLMRRALVGIVPDELLNRKRKAFFSRAPMAAISTESAALADVSHRMISASRGIVDSAALSIALQQARKGREIQVIALMRTTGLEYWLRSLTKRGLLLGLDADQESSLTHPATAETSVAPH